MKMQFKKPIVSETMKPISYSAKDFGMKGKSKGYRSKLCIIGCGIAGHEDVYNDVDMEVFIDDCKDNKVSDLFKVSPVKVSKIRLVPSLLSFITK